MNSQFINCPKCKTRNFQEDKICGVCKSPLYAQPTTQESKKQVVQAHPTNFKVILIFIGVILFVYFIYFKNTGAKSLSSDEIYTEDYLRTSPQTQLAVISDKSNPPKEVTIRLFSDLLSSLKSKFIGKSDQGIANALVSGYNIFVESGKRESLVEFTTSFDAYSREIESGKGFSIELEEALTLFIKGL